MKCLVNKTIVYFQDPTLFPGADGGGDAGLQEKVRVREIEEFRKQTDYISIVFIHTESARAGALVLVSLHLP